MFGAPGWFLFATGPLQSLRVKRFVKVAIVVEHYFLLEAHVVSLVHVVLGASLIKQIRCWRVHYNAAGYLLHVQHVHGLARLFLELLKALSWLVYWYLHARRNLSRCSMITKPRRVLLEAHRLRWRRLDRRLDVVAVLRPLGRAGRHITLGYLAAVCFFIRNGRKVYRLELAGICLLNKGPHWRLIEIERGVRLILKCRYLQTRAS